MSSSYGDPRTRLRILESARELAETAGPAMRLADVAKHAGVSRQALYLHFEDRSGLVLALLAHLQEAYGVQDLADRVAAASSPSERLGRMVELLATLHGHVDRVGWLFEEAQHLDEAFGRDWRDRARGTRRFVHAQVREIASEGALAGGWDVDSAADFTYGLVSLGSWREYTRDLGWSRRRYVARVSGWLERVLLAQGTAPPARSPEGTSAARRDQPAGAGGWPGRTRPDS